jgi:hypothetical protein
MEVFMSRTKYTYFYALSLAAFLILSMSSFHASANNATPVLIKQGSSLPRANLLKEGTHRYLSYFHDGESNMPIDIRTRTVRFETRDGKKHMQIKQRWDGAGKVESTKWIDSWFEVDTFVPLTHQRITARDGKKLTEGFIFQPNSITGMPDLAENTQKDMSVSTLEPTFNFETDIELLQTLPLEAGYQASINFYHPGGKTAPTRYLFKVIGSETIFAGGSMIECWIVTTDYNAPNSIAQFWFAKNTQLLVRKESGLTNGKKIIQVLLD